MLVAGGCQPREMSMNNGKRGGLISSSVVERSGGRGRACLGSWGSGRKGNMEEGKEEGFEVTPVGPNVQVGF